MSRYYSFNDYMDDVLEYADTRCHEKYQVGLEELYAVSGQTMECIRKLIRSGGWYVFVAVVALLMVGGVGLVAAAMAFLATPPGMVVAGILGVSALASIKKMYQERVLPEAVRDVGNQYKARWEHCEGNRGAVDQLVKEAAEALIKKAAQR